MSKTAWYWFYAGDYARDTGHLSLAEHGAYRLLLDHIYTSPSGHVPAEKDGDIDAACRICRAQNGPERQTVNSVLRQFFRFNGTGYHNKRADSEIIRRDKIGESRSEAAKKRWKNNESNNANAYASEYAKGYALAMQYPPAPSLSPAPALPQPQKNKNTRREKPILVTLPTEFGQHFSPSMLAWLEKRKESQLKAHLVWFVGHAEAKGWVYANWERAFQNAIREDWAKIRSSI